MATTTVQIIISKTAEQGDYKGRVFSGWETFQIRVKGEPVTKKRLWTMWMDVAQPFGKGDVIEFTGELGTKNGSYEKDGEKFPTVEHSLNVTQWRPIHYATPIPTEAPVTITDGNDQPF